MNQNESREAPPGLALRVALTIVILFGGLIFAIIYVAFFTASLSTFQKIAVILVVVLAMIGILSLMWASWGIKHGMKEKCRE
ncbi:MAG: hypothetical protein O8C63_08675 [Candidatus Methanoperedens sp.]|nr:hypothetical protein [Candidatus Methanoperedens sp.]